MNRQEAFKLISECVLLSTASFSVYYLLSTFLGDPSHRNNDEKDRTAKHLATLKNKSPELRKVLSSLSNYEKILLAYLIPPTDIDISFNDIGGLEDVVSDLRESVILPLVYPELFTQYGSLLAAPKGVLLYGPPGCGKTMLAKALAKESGSNFISIRMSTIMDKWFGESNKLIDALFSLANKLQPCIIFIDEIDSFLRERSSTDHEVTATLKAEFMTLWDGLVSSGRILILGATNRPGDIDSAFLRRMPKRFNIGLPNDEQRKKILNKLLSDVDVECDVDELVIATQGMSGSDLKELSRNAAVNSTREYIRKHLINTEGKLINKEEEISLRPLRLKDFLDAMDPENVMKLKSTTDLD
jgi:SpoVK/Ycf46/Vps4 family AAA+-type ATPase